MPIKHWISAVILVVFLPACSNPEQAANTLVASTTPPQTSKTIAPDEVIFTNMMIQTPLAPMGGNAQRGIEVITDRKRGNCVTCHSISALAKVPFQGDVGPSLDGAAERWQAGQLRALVVNAKTYFPNTVMPAYYRTAGLNRVSEAFAGKPILTAQEVEDVVAFLQTLRTGEQP